MANFTQKEIKEMQKNPDVLRALAHWHSAQETMADAIGDYQQCVNFHCKRKNELNTEADKIEAEWLAE